MEKQLLIQMIELSNNNRPFRVTNELALQIIADTELSDVVKIEDFSNEFYSIRAINYIKQCFNFKLL